MPLWLEVALTLGTPVLLLLIGRFVGRRIEESHFRLIERREARLACKPTLSTRQPRQLAPVERTSLALGSVVMSANHFRRFIAGFRMLFGGEVGSYTPLIERARREALLRMKESQPDAHAFFNTRLETSTISSRAGDEGMGTIEVFAYATAVVYTNPSGPTATSPGAKE